MNPKIIVSESNGNTVTITLTEFLALPSEAGLLPDTFAFSGYLSDPMISFPSHLCELRGNDPIPLRGRLANITRTDTNIGGEFILIDIGTPITDLCP